MKLSPLQSLVALAALLPATAAHVRGGEPLKLEKPEAVVPQNDHHGCYTNMTEIYLALKDDSKLDEHKRFVVCPDTIMDIGFLVPGVGIDEGQSPIIPRPNTEFVCGEDGSSRNNCVLRGGDFGVIAVPVFFREDTVVDNVKIRGFTFREQIQYGAFVAAGGSIAFEDCVFEVSRSTGIGSRCIFH